MVAIKIETHLLFYSELDRITSFHAQNRLKLQNLNLKHGRTFTVSHLCGAKIKYKICVIEHVWVHTSIIPFRRLMPGDVIVTPECQQKKMRRLLNVSYRKIACTNMRISMSDSVFVAFSFRIRCIIAVQNFIFACRLNRKNGVKIYINSVSSATFSPMIISRSGDLNRTNKKRKPT